MRFVCACVVVLMMATTALAKPKVAIAPFEGDSKDKVATAVADALADDAKVIAPGDVSEMMDRLGLSGVLESEDADKLERKLRASALVQGKLGKDGGKRTLKLIIHADGRRSAVTVRFKKPNDAFKSDVRDALARRLGVEGDQDEPRKKKRLTDDDEPKSKQKSDDDEDRPKKKKKAKIVADDDDEDRPKKKKKKKKRVASDDDDEDDGEDDEVVRRGRSSVYAVIRVDGGGSFGIRRLTYASTGANAPPRVGTAAGGGRIAAEIYPFALGSSRGKSANVGLVGDYDKTVGLSITVPGTGGTKAPIDQAHFSVGAQYRVGLGKSALTLGARYAKRHYIADRSGLPAPTSLDAPDVDYTALAPTITLRAPLSPKAALFGMADGLVIVSTGPIQRSDQYGASSVYGFEVCGGVDYALSSKFSLRVAGELSNISLKFKGTGTMATARGVSGATDRTFGIAATLGVAY
jgi:hypothetical protein